MNLDLLPQPQVLLLEWHPMEASSLTPSAQPTARRLLPIEEVAPPPPAIMRAGEAAGFAWDEFFLGDIRNPYTRRNYLHAVRVFLNWLDARGVDLALVTPAHVGHYLDTHPGSAPTKKLHLAAIRALFDKLVLRHVIVLNPAHAVHGPKHQTQEGRTPEITPTEVRVLLNSIGGTDPVSLRDRAILGTLVYTAARVGAVAALRLDDLDRDGVAWSLRFREKGGKQRTIPVRDDLRHMLDVYLRARPPAVVPNEALFLAAAGKTGTLTDRPLSRIDTCRMVKRRLRRAGLSARLSPHSFRVAVITDLLQHGASLEDVQNLAGHADPRTTRLYDRRQRQVTRNLVERITL